MRKRFVYENMFYLRESVLHMRTYFIYIIRKCFIYVKIVQYIRGIFYVLGLCFIFKKYSHIFIKLFINLKSCIIFDTAIIYILTNVILSGSARHRKTRLLAFDCHRYCKI